MPQAKPKPSEIAAEAKRVYIPMAEKHYGNYGSVLYSDSSYLPVKPEARSRNRPRVAVMDGDAIDVALGWQTYNSQNSNSTTKIPVVNQANEKRAGGDWESGLLAPEESFARRSTLVRALTTPSSAYTTVPVSHYPIPQRGGMYSPSVGMNSPFRLGNFCCGMLIPSKLSSATGLINTMFGGILMRYQ